MENTEGEEERILEKVGYHGKANTVGEINK
jgi:hypothetical protein